MNPHRGPKLTWPGAWRDPRALPCRSTPRWAAKPTSSRRSSHSRGSGLSCEVFGNHLGNFRFYLEISNWFITGAEPAYHGGITVELMSNLDCFHAAPGAGQVCKL